MTSGRSETAVILNGSTGLPVGTTTSLPSWMNSMVQAVGEANGRPIMPAKLMPTEIQRASIGSRIEALERELEPATNKEIAQAVIDMFMAYPSQSLSLDAQRNRVALFTEALSGLPLWALNAASLKWRRGEVPGNAAFAASAGEWRRIAEPLTFGHRIAIRKLNRVLVSQALRPEEEMPPEKRAAIAAKFSDLARSISDNARREAP